MASLRYDLAAVAVYDPVALNRNATRNVLYALGFRSIDSFASLDDLKRAALAREFDLIVVEVAKAGDPVCRFVADIRRSAMGANPFMVVMATTWIAEGPLVRDVLDCGTDDLLTRPFSTNLLAERIRTLVRARKGFVVTSDYVGPDRRKDTNRESTVRLIPVVNSLKLKAVEHLSGFDAQQAAQNAIAAARREIDLERMRRAAFQIGVIAGFVRAQATGASTAGPVRKSDLERIVSVAHGLKEMASADGVEQAAKTCQIVIETAEKSLDGSNLATNAEILVRLSVALQVTLTPGRVARDCEVELDQTLDKIRMRGRHG